MNHAHEVGETLQAIRQTRVTVFGDFCLDAHWHLDADESERSLETGLTVSKVRRQHYVPGGAGNVAANLAALGARTVRAIGVIGDDPFGALLREHLSGAGVDVTGLLTPQEDWQTLVYGKPILNGVEQCRLDFGAFNQLTDDTQLTLADKLACAAAESDVIILNQQIPNGTSPAPMIERINGIVAQYDDRLFIADSRHRPRRYERCLLKMNAHEAAAWFGEHIPRKRVISAHRAKELARLLAAETNRPVFITCGLEGIAIADADGARTAPAIPVAGPVDPTGAGDTVLATVAAALAAKCSMETAARLAMLAAAVTIQKLNQTGAATPKEILRIVAGLR